MGLDGLPLELLLAIRSWLDSGSATRLLLSSRRLLGDLAWRQPAALTQLRLLLEDSAHGPASPDVEKDGGLFVSICQCPAHVPAHAAFLARFLDGLGPGLRTLIVEDFLLGLHCRLAPLTLSTLVEFCPLLSALELQDVDLGAVPPKTLAKLGRLRNLRQIGFNDCIPGIGSLGRLGDGLLGRVLGAGLGQISLRHCGSITDAGLRHIATQCPHLWLADFGGCEQVTSRGVAEFAFSLSRRVPDLLWLRVEGTDVDGMELQNRLDASLRKLSPFRRLGPNALRKWECKSVQMELGCRQACAISNPLLPNKTILLSV